MLFGQNTFFSLYPSSFQHQNPVIAWLVQITGNVYAYYHRKLHFYSKSILNFALTVVPRYLWLLPMVVHGSLPGSPDIDVHGSVRAVDGGLSFSGEDDTFLKVGNFDRECLHDPSKCPKGLSLSCKMKFDKVRYHVRKYHIISYRIVSYRIVSYHIISYHIISYRINQLTSQ